MPGSARRALLGIAAYALGVAPRTTSGQAVRGVVADSGGTPVPGVVVLMLDAASNPVARVLSNERGEYRVATPRPGTYQLQTLRIGFRPAMSEPIALRSSEEATHRLVLAMIPVPLAALRIEGKRSCRTIADATTFSVWEQARTALIAAQITAAARAVTATTVTYDHMLDAGGRRTLAESASVHTEFVSQPWRSLPPQQVRQIGYVSEDTDGTVTYSAPGLDVLLSTLFIEDHCFRLVNGSDKRRVGIAFQPTDDREKRREIADIRGTLWLDRASAELRSLEFRYVNLSAEQEANAGGAMEFVRMRDGTWAVSRWNIRMPALQQQIQSRAMGGNQVRLTGIKVTGGELALAVRGGDTLWAQPPLTLSGTVIDSASGNPAGAARVRLGATGVEVAADARGQFAMPGVHPGTYTLDVRTPSLDSVSTVHRVPVTFVREGSPIELRVPTAAQVVGALCGSRPLDAAGIAVGTVSVRGDSALPRGIRVVAEWADTTSTARGGEPSSVQARWIEVRPDARGTFRMCGVPLGTAITVRAEANDFGTVPSTARITTGRSARIDVVLDRAVSRGAVFTGAVLDSLQHPVAGAEIVLSTAGKSTLSTDAGAFRVSDVPPGAHRVLVRRLGFGPLDTTITFSPNQTVDRRIYLRRVVTLDSVTVTADRVAIPDFEEHRARGFGHFLTRDQLAKQEGRLMGDILRELPTVGVVQGTGNRAWLTSSRIGVQGRQGSAQELHWADSLAGAQKGRCYVAVYLDNTLVYRGRPGEPLFNVNSLSPAQIEAVEYYSSQMQAPPRYSGAESVCGVLAIWTRRAR